MASVVVKAMDVGSLVTSSVCPTQLNVKPERDYRERQNRLCLDPWLIEYTFVRIPPLFCLCYG